MNPNPLDDLPSPHPRLEREWQTVAAMIKIFCHDRHAPAANLCPDCAALATYVHRRLAKCPFQETKSTCAKCLVHCYRTEMRERIRTVMRYSGPRMLLRHPILVLRHRLDGRKEAPELVRRTHRRSPAPAAADGSMTSVMP